MGRTVSMKGEKAAKPKPKWELLDSTYTKAEMIAIKTSLGDRSASPPCPLEYNRTQTQTDTQTDTHTTHASGARLHIRTSMHAEMTVISAPGCPPRLTRATTHACTDARLPHMKYAPPQRALGARGQFLRASEFHACTLLSWVIYPESNIRLLIDLLIYVSCLFYAVCPRHLRILSHLTSPTHPPSHRFTNGAPPPVSCTNTHCLSQRSRRGAQDTYRLPAYPRGSPARATAAVQSPRLSLQIYTPLSVGFDPPGWEDFDRYIEVRVAASGRVHCGWGLAPLRMLVLPGIVHRAVRVAGRKQPLPCCEVLRRAQSGVCGRLGMSDRVIGRCGLGVASGDSFGL